MVPTSTLFQICTEHRIDVTYHNLGTNLRGLYIRHPRLRRPLIVLHDSLRANERLMRCVLAEEIGHHLTGSGNYMIGYNQNTRVWLDKAEYLAVKWAANFLIPREELIYQANRREFHELADYFFVTEDFLRWHLDRLFVFYDDTGTTACGQVVR